MLARAFISAYTILLFALLAVATNCPPATTTTLTVSAPGPTVTVPVSQCNTGNVQCCNQVVTVSVFRGTTLYARSTYVMFDANSGWLGFGWNSPRPPEHCGH